MTAAAEAAVCENSVPVFPFSCAGSLKVINESNVRALGARRPAPWRTLNFFLGSQQVNQTTELVVLRLNEKLISLQTLWLRQSNEAVAQIVENGAKVLSISVDEKAVLFVSRQRISARKHCAQHAVRIFRQRSKRSGERVAANIERDN